jgi:tetratricopeptide (TPR) repeat protein
LDRDLRLLRIDHAEHPRDPFILFNLGSVLQELGESAEALRFLRHSLELSHPSDSIVRKLYAVIVQCHRRLGEGAAALAACRAGRRHYPDDAELLFLEGMLQRQQGDLSGAEANWLRVLERREGAHFASVDTGLEGYKARHNLALLYHEQGRCAEAEAQWLAALREKPDFAPAWLGLAELLLALRQWEALEEAAHALSQDARLPVEANVLRARAHLARREFDAAKELLGSIIAEAPKELWPRVILSHVYLQEGTDWPAAEQALRDVLALDPEHTEARHNLDLLLQQSSRNGRTGGSEAAELTVATS